MLIKPIICLAINEKSFLWSGYKHFLLFLIKEILFTYQTSGNHPLLFRAMFGVKTKIIVGVKTKVSCKFSSNTIPEQHVEVRLLSASTLIFEQWHRKATVKVHAECFARQRVRMSEYKIKFKIVKRYYFIDFITIQNI